MHCYKIVKTRNAVVIMLIAVVALSCSTVQSIIKSTFPYTASLSVPAGAVADETMSVSSSATSLDQLFGNQSGSEYVKDIRVANLKLDAVIPRDQNLGVFKSISIYLVAGDKEVMIASRKDIGSSIGGNLVLDVDNSRLVDEYVKGNNIKVRMEFVLRNNLTSAITLRSAINFSAMPNTK